jgi:hypothetical protein
MKCVFKLGSFKTWASSRSSSSVSFIGYILLTKSLSYNDAALTGIPFISESSKYLEFISPIWKWPYYDKF